MGIPIRLHGDAKPDDFGNQRGFCTKCLALRKWNIVREKGKFYKQCEKCRSRWEIKGIELSKLREKAKKERSRKVRKSITTKAENTRSTIICPYCFRSFLADQVLKDNQTIKCPFCRSVLDEAVLKGEKR